MKRASVRLVGHERRQLIIEAAVRVARRDGLAYVTHARVADECFWPTSVTTVWRLMGSTAKLVDATAVAMRRRKSI